MASDFRSLTALFPANTPIATPVSRPLSVGIREVEFVEFTIPPGPGNTVGFALAFAGQAVVPSGAGEWIIADGITIHWPLEGYGNSGAWSLIGYNTGQFDHMIYVRFGLRLPSLPAAPALVPMSGNSLSGIVT